MAKYDKYVIAVFILSIVLGIGYDVLTKKKATPPKSKIEIFVEFLLDQLMHFAMLASLILGLKGIDLLWHWTNGPDDLTLFPKNPQLQLSLEQFLRLFDFSAFLVTIHYMIRGLVDVFRGV